MPTDERTNEELSAAIAERLFGLAIENGKRVGISDGWRYHFPVKPYASDHNAALGLVVPAMRKRGYRFEMEDDWDFGDGKAMGVGIRFRTMKQARVEMTFTPFGQEPRAICLAALAALDAERKEE